jgi:hypothetical protein
MSLLENNKTTVLESQNESKINTLKIANQQNESISTRNEINQTNNSEDEEIWIPRVVEECLSKVNVGEPIKVATFINPYYLRGNFDGNNLEDYAVLIEGQTSKNEGKIEKKNGLVICKDGIKPYVFGAVSKPKKHLSSFEDDNFVTGDWEILTREETRKTLKDAKGEAIGFFFEGGDGIYVYWDGKTFVLLDKDYQ